VEFLGGFYHFLDDVYNFSTCLFQNLYCLDYISTSRNMKRYSGSSGGIRRIILMHVGRCDASYQDALHERSFFLI
jgi:hypothetical protein